jgi:hypothetical protein
MVPDAWCLTIGVVLLEKSRWARSINYDAYSDTCLEAICAIKASNMKHSRENYEGWEREGLCNRASKPQVAITVWSAFGACILAITVIGLVSKANAGKPTCSSCEALRDKVCHLWEAVAPLVLLAGLVVDIITDVLQFYFLLPNRFAYLLLVALFLPTVVVGGIWHFSRPAAAGVCSCLWRLLTAPVTAPAWGLWLNGQVILAMAVNLLRRQPLLHRPSWLEVDIPTCSTCSTCLQCCWRTLYRLPSVQLHT